MKPDDPSVSYNNDGTCCPAHTICSPTHLYVKDSRLLPQLSKLQVSSVVPVGRQEVEPVDLGGASWVVPVRQVHLVHVSLGERQRRRQRNAPQQELAVARQLRDDVGEVGGSGVRVCELQLDTADGFHGAVLEPQTGVEAERGWDAVAVFDGEVEDATTGRVAVGDDKTVTSEEILMRMSHYSAVWSRMKQLVFLFNVRFRQDWFYRRM